MKEERLYIVGYMASGKTTFGKALARRLGWDFVDTDDEVVKLAGKSIPDIMRHEGEPGFRLLESKVLKGTVGLRKAVIACGGGTPCNRDNMEFMTLHGMTLWLLASSGRIAARIESAGGGRPLVEGMKGKKLVDFIETHLRKRQPFYGKAFWRFSGEHLENDKEIQAAVEDFIAKFLPGVN